MRTLVMIVVLWSLVVASAVAQERRGQLRVSVRSEGEPIAGASVVAGGQTVATGADGVAQVDAAPGPVVVTVTKEGFFDGKGEGVVRADQVATVEIELFAQPEVEEEEEDFRAPRGDIKAEDVFGKSSAYVDEEDED